MTDNSDDFVFGDSVDRNIFDQILEMDEEDDDTHEFSSSIVRDYLDQAEQTFQKMDKLLEEKDLEALSAEGHFLKGSSATLGFIRIRDACEKIQHFGQKKQEDGLSELEADVALSRIKDQIKVAKRDFLVIERLMHRFFGF